MSSFLGIFRKFLDIFYLYSIHFYVDALSFIPDALSVKQRGHQEWMIGDKLHARMLSVR